MTVTDACAVNDLCDHLLASRRARYPVPPKVAAALEQLARGAHKRLIAGWTPEQVRDAVGGASDAP